jgi:hypothetical protein
MGNHFEDIGLKSLGIRIFLGHGGDPCGVPGDLIEDFTIVDTSGIYVLDIQFCGCYATPGGSHNRIQLLRVGLFPGTHTRPSTAFTFNILDTFHLLTLQSKISAYDYFTSIVRKSDNTGCLGTKVRPDLDFFNRTY